MDLHDWMENSSTTRRCARCGAIRYSLDARGSYTTHARARRYEYATHLGARLKLAQPPCVVRVSVSEVVEAVERAKATTRWPS